jgi:surfeit locus 1 family protein
MRAFLQRPLITLKIADRIFAPSTYGVVFTLLGILVFCQLANWQNHRAREKEIIMARYESRAHLAALPLSDVLRLGNDVVDFPVRMQGHFDNSHTFFLDNQPQDGRSGFHIYTPFLPAGDTHYVLVNRGWLPRAERDRLLPVIPDATAAEVSGTLAFPSAFFTVGPTDYQQRPLRVPRLEMDKLSQTLGVELRPFVLLLEPTAADGFRRKWDPAKLLAMGPDRHRAYAFQWFALALAVFVVFIVVNLRKVGVDVNE